MCLAAGGGTTARADAVVFMYHRFGEAGYPSTNIRLEQFEHHLEHLSSAGYRIWPLEQIVAQLREGRPIPDRTVAITVDDAYLSIYSEAFPRLRRRGWPFTVFVSTDAVDQGLPGYMSWDQIRELAAQGTAFANHSRSHDYLVRRAAGEDAARWEQRVTADIRHAQARLEEELGTAPLLFAYPYGEYSEVLARIVRRLGYAAFGQHSGAIGAHSDLRALPRYPMAEDYGSLDEFRTKAASLALPVLEVTPWDPVQDDPRPVMTVTLAASSARLDQLSCYASGLGRAPVTWIERNERRFSVRTAAPFGAGRGRYNCTAPAAEPGRFYWFSHPWIIAPRRAPE